MAPPAIPDARFGHVSIVAADWERLKAFYIELFGCEFVPPERDMRGAVLERGTGVAAAAFRGGHLRLPGLGADGPTLEIYRYETALPRPAPIAANRPGIAHLAFAVPDVMAARNAVLAAGGSIVGEIVTTETADGRHVTWCYVTDPEGNILELQRWGD